ncbi:translesion DNA synthesis-associated protein ImuA [Pandoraea cepalis]|uniref:Translesion DNA synthesis-associated protein ImuA n=2 Tax=Pandoraea cepalis TaxID=2508294 RepID=A0AAW7MK28_9BURK|nr:translesion DNA synthesis-associated protein ImuA [Pandoraea cepalis]MDN4577932.1 translesion DNA synthesis-associated protein ImuA [Pandoraea cepalis]
MAAARSRISRRWQMNCYTVHSYSILGCAMTLPLSSLPAGLWRASELAHCHRAGHTTGFAALDAELPGAGWPHGAVTELLSERPGIGEWRLLAPALRDLTQAGQPVMVIAPPMLPYAPALAGWGIDLRWLSVVMRPVRPVSPARQAPRARGTRGLKAEDRDMLWCAEQALKSACCGAVLTWLPAATPEQIRRLQVAAGGGETLTWVVRGPAAAATASAAPLRLGLAVGPGSRLGVQFHKRRGPPRHEPLWLTLPAPYAHVSQPVTGAADDARSGPVGPGPAPSSTPSTVPLVSVSGVSHGLLDRPASALSGARDRLSAHTG